MSTLRELKHPPLRSPRSDSFWGVNLSNVPSPTTESDISNEFKRYGDIFSVKRTGNESGSCSINVVFRSPKKPNSISDIANHHLKYDVNALDVSQLPAEKKPSIAKINLCGGSAAKGKSKKFVSKLSRDAVPFSAPRGRPTVHTTKTADDEGVLFEAQCKSITFATTEEQLLDWMALNLLSSIKDDVANLTMLPGESMAVFELTDRDAISRLTDIVRSKGAASFNGHRFTVQRKSSEEAPSPGKGLSVLVDDSPAEEKVEYLMGMGFHHGLSKEVGGDKGRPEDSAKNFYFKLPEEAKQYVVRQGDSLDIPKTAFVMQLSVLTTNGPIPIQQYRQWKLSHPADGTASASSIKSTPCSSRKTDITSNLDPESVRSKKSEASTLALQSPDSDIVTPTPAVTALFGDAASAPLKRGSPLSNGLQKAMGDGTRLTASASAGSVKPTPSSVFKMGPPSLAKTASTGSATKNTAAAAATTNGAAASNSSHSGNGSARMFQYPQFPNNGALPQLLTTSPLPGSVGVVPNMGTLISPRCSLIRMNGGNGGLNAVNIPSTQPPPVVVPNGTDFAPLHQQNVGTGFAMTTPIANLTPVHIPNLVNGANAANSSNAASHSPIGNNPGFRSPINYNINTPQSPIGNYTGITPIIGAFTPTANNGLNAITPTASIPFYWNNLTANSGAKGLQSSNGHSNHHHANNNNAAAPNHNNGAVTTAGGGGVSRMGTINMENDPMAPHNMQTLLSNGAANNYVQKQLQHSLLRPPLNQNGGGSPVSDPKPSTFFNYPVPSEEPRSSPSGSNNVALNGHSNLMMNGANGGGAQFHGNGGGGGMMNGGMMCPDDEGHDERPMDEPPTMEEMNNLRAIPSVISPNGTTPVVMITNLNEDEIDCDKIFTLCGVFGDVQRVKISYHKRDTAFVQLANHRQAKHVVTSLNRMQLYGKMIHVNLSRMTRVKLPKDSPNSAMMFPDAKFLTKDYTNCKRHRYAKKGAGGIKYSPLSIGQPSHILHIANLPIQSEAKDLQLFLCGHSAARNGSVQDRYHRDDKIQSIELIGVNNKLGSCQAFAKCHSVDMACQILIDWHSKEFLGREIKISFATRSHMPSDINKTHKTYSYNAAKKPGASINSIPASVPRRDSMSSGQHNSGDSLSSGSSNGGGHLSGGSGGGHHGDRGYGHGEGNGPHHGMEHGAYRNGYGRGFPSQHNRNQYLPYDHSPYQTYVVHKEQSLHDDKIFVRQHHHSGGRKYHYKLRINK